MAYDPEHFLQNKEKYAEKSRLWREKNPEKAKENRRKYYLEHKQKELDYSTKLNRLRKTGVTEEQYQKQYLIQKGLCAICDRPSKKALAADHCHSTGHFRGLLCTKCNRGLGYLNDDIFLLKRATEYLKNVSN